MTGSSFRLLNKGISIKSLDSLTALAPEKGGDPRSGEDRKRIEALDG